MRTFPALAVLDFSSIATGARATDALLKKAPVAFYRAGTVTRGRFLTLFGGSPAAVEEALEEGLARGGNAVLDHVYLADVHPRLSEAIAGARAPERPAPLAVVETDTVSSIVLAAERVLKGTGVELVELRLADEGLSGKGLAVFRGELHDLEEAQAIASRSLRPGCGLVVEILPRPHETYAHEIIRGTAFAASRFVELDGEAG